MTNENQLIEQLVNKLTRKRNDSKLIQKTKYKLRYEKCTSTSENQVDITFAGLIDKFNIQGHSELAKAIQDYKVEFLKDSRPVHPDTDINQKHLKYDLLRLLSVLTSSSNQNYDYIPTRDSIQNTTLTWQDIVKDDPLEGDHWQSWPEDSSSSTDLSDAEVEDIEPKQTQKPTEPNIDFKSQMDIDERQDQQGLNHLVTQQYWREDFNLSLDETNENILTNPCQLSQALKRLFYSESEGQKLKTITEANVIREVLGMLRGYSGILLTYQKYEFLIDQHYMLQHTSQSALTFLLNEFCEYGNILIELRKIMQRIIQSDQYGQTSQAFAETIYKSLLDFDTVLGSYEADTSIVTQDPTKTISILKLKNTVDPTMSRFKTIHDIVMDVPFLDGDPRTISTTLISTLYDHILTAQTSGQTDLYDTLVYVFQQTIVPFGRMIDEWLYYGSLDFDKYQEFYVCKYSEVPDSNFWKSRFSIQSMDYPVCPLFDPFIMSRIFFTGKAINLLNHLQKKQLDTRYQSLVDVMNQHVPIKLPFITKSYEAPRENNMNEYTSTLFPLMKKTSTIDTMEVIQENIGSLFDQDLKRSLEEYIQEPYQIAANELNRVLSQDCGLKEQLTTLASIYLMLENDMMHSFCETIFYQMDQGDVWFDERVLNQTFREITNNYNVYIHINKQTKDLNQLEQLEFKVQIAWPLNNIIQKEQLISYSKILKFLMRLKRAKYVMEKKTLFRKQKDKVGKIEMYYYMVRVKILWFINAFWRYIMTTILHAETINFRDKLSMSKDADEMIELHNAYVRRLVDRCLLNEKANGIRKSILGIFDMAEEMMKLFEKYLNHHHDNMGQLNDILNTIEKDFNRTNEFIAISLMILGKKAGLPWFESLAISLSAQ